MKEEKIYFGSPDWENAKKVFDFYKQETTCLDRFGRLNIRPEYIVAIDDDVISALYAVQIFNMAIKRFKHTPKMLFVGGMGMFTKHINRLEDGTILSEAQKLWSVANKLGVSRGAILDNGNNTGANIKEIIDYLASHGDSKAPIIFCLTQRLSKRIERTIAYSTVQFPSTAPLNAFYYVPGESLQEVCQMYNGRAIAGGLPLLSEAAALYDRMNRYVGRYMAKMDKHIDKDVVRAGEALVNKYPIRVSRCPIMSPSQFCKMYFGIKKHRQDIAEDLQAKIAEWKYLI